MFVPRCLRYPMASVVQRMEPPLHTAKYLQSRGANGCGVECAQTRLAYPCLYGGRLKAFYSLPSTSPGPRMYTCMETRSKQKYKANLHMGV